MNTPEFILSALFFVVNSFSVCFICINSSLAQKKLEKKLDETISFIRWVKARHDTTHMYTLHKLLEILIQQERYEEVAKVQKMIEQEMEDLKNGDI